MISVSVVYLTVLPLFFAAVLLFISLRIEVVKLANAEAIAAVVEQLGKAKGEILGRISELEAAAAAGEDLSGPLADLAAAAQGLDDVVPDAVVEEVVAEVAAPVEEPVEEAPAGEV